MWCIITITDRHKREFKSRELDSTEMVPMLWLSSSRDTVQIPVELLLTTKYISLIEKGEEPDHSLYKFQKFKCAVQQSFGMCAVHIISILKKFELCLGTYQHKIETYVEYNICRYYVLGTYSECRRQLFFGESSIPDCEGNSKFRWVVLLYYYPCIY